MRPIKYLVLFLMILAAAGFANYIPSREYVDMHYKSGRYPAPVFELLCESVTGFQRYGSGSTVPTLDTTNKLTGTGAVKVSNPIRAITAFATSGGGAATLVTSAAHAFPNAAAVTIAGSPGGAYDGTHTVTFVGTGTFTIPVAYSVAIGTATPTASFNVSVSLRYTLPAAVDIRQMNFRIKYKVGFDPLPQRQAAAGIFVDFHSGTFASTHRRRVSVMHKEGWNILENSCSHLVSGASFNPAAVTDVTLTVDSGLMYLPPGGEIIWDFFEFYPNGSKAGIIFGLDDATESQYTKGIVYLAKYGFPSVLYTPGERLGTAGYMTTAQLADAKRKGAAIATHSQYGLLNFLDAKTATRKTVSAISRTSDVVTVACTGHGFATGDLVLINVGSSAAATLFNGFRTVLTATDPDVFTYQQYWADNAGTGLSGTATPYTHDEIDEALHKWCYTQKKYLFDLGYERDCDYMALPAGGRYSVGQQQLRGPQDLNIFRQYFTNVRGTITYWHDIPGYTNTTFQGGTSIMPRYPRDTWWAWPRGGGAIGAASLDTHKAYVDEAIAAKGVAVINVHEILDTPLAGETQTAAWEAFVDYVKEKVDAGVLEVLSQDAVTYSANNSPVRRSGVKRTFAPGSGTITLGGE